VFLFVHPLSFQGNSLPSIDLPQEVPHPRNVTLYLNAGTLLTFDGLQEVWQRLFDLVFVHPGTCPQGHDSYRGARSRDL
jgi:hypothetical protein